MLPGEQRNDDARALADGCSRAGAYCGEGLYGIVAALRVELQAARDEAAAKDANLASLREKNHRMHRRAQAAESQIGVTIDDCIRQGRSLGRGLANAGFMGEREKRIAAETDLSAARRTLDETVTRLRALREKTATFDELVYVDTLIPALNSIIRAASSPEHRTGIDGWCPACDRQVAPPVASSPDTETHDEPAREDCPHRHFLGDDCTCAVPETRDDAEPR